MIDTHYDLTMKPLPVTLSEQAVIETIAFANQVRADKKSHSVNSARHIIDKKSNVEAVNLLGFLGEAVVAEVMNAKWEKKVVTEGDTGWDLYIGKLATQVKVGNGKSLIFKTLDYFSTEADIVIYAEFLGDRTDPAQNPEFQLWGWCSRKDFMNNYQIRDFGYGDQFYLPAKQLRTLATLSEWA